MARIKTGYQDKQLCLTEAGARQSPCERTVANVRFWPRAAGRRMPSQPSCGKGSRTFRKAHQLWLPTACVANWHVERRMRCEVNRQEAEVLGPSECGWEHCESTEDIGHAGQS